MKCAYFARPMSAYNSPQDRRDVRDIEKLGFHVIEITDDFTQVGAQLHGMKYFRHIVEQAEALFFRAFPDEMIGAGVAQEISWAYEENIPVFEMPGELASRELDVDTTRRMLELCGQR